MKLFDSGNCLESAAVGLEGATGRGRQATHSLTHNTYTHMQREINNLLFWVL